MKKATFVCLISIIALGATCCVVSSPVIKPPIEQHEKNVSAIQSSSDASVDVQQNEQVATHPASSGCPEGMLRVEGQYCPAVVQQCKRWLDTNTDPSSNGGIGPMRCAEFFQSKCISKEKKHLDFCMDIYEWPNVAGELPPVSISWYEAKQQCENIGKRLCTAEEWTFACEGEDSKPYPYGDGYHRDANACNIDKEPMPPTLPRSEWPKHYRGVRSGSMPACVSWAGIHDMTGNVDEWVNNVGGKSDGDPYFSGLKGGYWGPVRTRCRPMTTVHGPTHSFYQNGSRCCRPSMK